jgi:hypothetical protein
MGSLLMAAGLHAAAPTEDAISKLIVIYERQTAAIQESHSERMQNWPMKYSSALKALLGKEQKKGNLAGWNAIDKEMSRFKQEGTLLESNVVRRPSSLSETQSQVMKQLAVYEHDRIQAVVELQERYEARLKQLTGSYMKSGDIARARAANDEIERSGGLPLVTSAKFSSAIAETEDLRPKTSSMVSMPSRPAPEGIMIHSEKSGRTTRARKYSRFANFETGFAKVNGPTLEIKAEAIKRTVEATAGFNRHRVYQTQLRFLVSSRQDVPAGYMVDLRLCGKPASTYRGYYRVWDAGRYRYVTRQAETVFAYSVAESLTFSLSQIGRNETVIDVKGVPDRTLNSWQGQEFAGHILSIFAPRGELIYQSTSLGGLKAFAPRQLTEILAPDAEMPR